MYEFRKKGRKSCEKVGLVEPFNKKEDTTEEEKEDTTGKGRKTKDA